MAKRLVDVEHLRSVATLSCYVCKANGVQVHHLLKPSDKLRGMSLRSGDDQTLPLCFKCHSELHTKYGNEDKFFKDKLGDENAGRKKAAELYKRTLWEREHPEDELPF